MAHKPLFAIAGEISKDWTNVSPYAKPYLEAMFTLGTVEDYYYCDSGHSIVAYFLANAGTWRGEAARKIKAELKEMIK